MITVTPRWCHQCEMDLFLSDEPHVIDDKIAFCDICAAKVGEDFVEEVNEIKSLIRDCEREIDDLEIEIENLDRSKRKVERKLSCLKDQLKNA